VIEGKLTDINLTGNNRLRNAYLKPRIEAAGGPPLRLQDLRDQLELLRQNPNIEQVNAELRPGAELGESALDVRVSEQSTFELGVIFDNHRSPSVGASASARTSRTATCSAFPTASGPRPHSPTAGSTSSTSSAATTAATRSGSGRKSSSTTRSPSRPPTPR
jgi:hypothetical protein